MIMIFPVTTFAFMSIPLVGHLHCKLLTLFLLPELLKVSPGLYSSLGQLIATYQHSLVPTYYLVNFQCSAHFGLNPTLLLKLEGGTVGDKRLHLLSDATACQWRSDHNLQTISDIIPGYLSSTFLALVLQLHTAYFYFLPKRHSWTILSILDYSFYPVQFLHTDQWLLWHLCCWWFTLPHIHRKNIQSPGISKPNWGWPGATLHLSEVQQHSLQHCPPLRSQCYYYLIFTGIDPCVSHGWLGDPTHNYRCLCVIVFALDPVPAHWLSAPSPFSYRIESLHLCFQFIFSSHFHLVHLTLPLFTSLTSSCRKGYALQTQT